MDNNSHKHSNFENENNSHAVPNPNVTSNELIELLSLCENDVLGRVNLLQPTSMTLAQTYLDLPAMPAVTIPTAISINNNKNVGNTGPSSATNLTNRSSSKTAVCAQVLGNNDISLLEKLEMDGAIQNNTYSSFSNLNTNTNSNKGKGDFPSDSEQKQRLFQDPKILMQTNTYSSSSDQISSENGIDLCPPRVNCPEKIVC